MSNVTDYLEQLDISDSEAKIYLKLLETGPLSVRALAETTGIERTNTYKHVDKLIEKGLVMKLVKRSSTQVAANQPEEIIPALIEQKVQVGKKLQDHWPQILDTIQTAIPHKKSVDEAEIKYYKGKLGVKKIYEEALRAKELRSYVNLGIMANALPENSSLFSKALENNKTIKMFEIIENSPRSKEQEEFQSSHENHERYFYKFLPQGVTLSSTDTLIYDGNVAIVNVRNQITGVVLQNTDYYNNAKELFDLIWKGLPEVKHEITD